MQKKLQAAAAQALQLSQTLAALADQAAAEAAPATPAAPPAPAVPAAPRLEGMLGFAIPDGVLHAGGEAMLDRIAALGAKIVRFDIRLGNVMTASGTFTWSNIDRMVNGLTSRGIRVLGLLNAAASEVSTATGRARFRTMAQAAVRRYGDRVEWWEILNEANHTPLTPEQYTELLKAVYPAIKLLQPNATVLYVGNASIPTTKSASLQSAEEYLTRVYAAGGGAFFDALGHHPYQYPYTYATDVDWGGLAIMRRLRAIMDRNKDGGKLIWITEAGAPTDGIGNPVSEADQAATLRQIVEMARRPGSGLGPICWYELRDRATGSDTEAKFGIETAKGSPKLAAAVFQELAAKA